MNSGILGKTWWQSSTIPIDRGFFALALLITFNVVPVAAGQTAASACERKSSRTQPDVVKHGVEVEQVDKGYEANRAGLQKGDILLRWSRDGQGGAIESPFDFFQLTVEQRPLGVITIEGLREAKRELGR